MKRSCLLPFLLGIIFIPLLASGHELHLKNGTVIQTDSVIKKDGRLSYQQYGGMITIDLSEVEKIQYDHRYSDGTGGNKADTPGTGSTDQLDLRRALAAKLAPSTPVEEANLSVVTIVTEAGSGSGFFISDDGLIVTNRHVIRGSKTTDVQVKEQMNEAANRLETSQSRLDREEEQLDIYRRKLQAGKKKFREAVADQTNRIDPQNKAEFESNLKERENYLKQWQSDYNQRKEVYKTARAEFASKKRNYAQTSKRLSAQTRFKVLLADGTEKSAIFYRTSDTFDLALLKIDGYKTPYLPAGNSADVTLGQQVYAIGSPLQLNNTVTSGVISSSRGDFLQTNAEIYPGNSGGPLITENGRVVGVNTKKRITEKFEGLGFAIKFSRVREEFSDYLN